jgi:hypothetical protein
MLLKKSENYQFYRHIILSNEIIRLELDLQCIINDFGTNFSVTSCTFAFSYCATDQSIQLVPLLRTHGAGGQNPLPHIYILNNPYVIKYRYKFTFTFNNKSLQVANNTRTYRTILSHFNFLSYIISKME